MSARTITSEKARSVKLLRRDTAKTSAQGGTGIGSFHAWEDSRRTLQEFPRRYEIPLTLPPPGGHGQ